MSPRTMSLKDDLRTRVVDEAIERYVDWREESSAVQAAYAIWSSAQEGDGALAFAAYGAALDREECAASQYLAVVERAEQLLATDLVPAR